jgi:hypothetical protein
MKHNYLNLLLVVILAFGLGLACSETKAGESKPGETKADLPAKVADETVRGFHFIYFKVPAGLDEKGLIETAQKLHDREPDAQLILVDDDSQLEDYIKYTKDISAGNYDGKLPREWVDRHIVGNVQKFTSGKFKLCRGAGGSEIADLK